MSLSQSNIWVIPAKTILGNSGESPAIAKAMTVDETKKLLDINKEFLHKFPLTTFILHNINSNIEPARGILSKGLSKNFTKNFDSDKLYKFSWFEVHSINGKLLLSDFRVNSFDKLIRYIKSNITNIDEYPITVTSYIKQNNTPLIINGYNEQLSMLKGRRNLMDSRTNFSRLLYMYPVGTSSFEGMHNLITTIYSDIFSKTLSTNQDLENATFTITTPGKTTRQASLPKNNVFGTVFGRSNEVDSVRMVYNTVTKQFQSWDSAFIGGDELIFQNTYFYINGKHYPENDTTFGESKWFSLARFFEHQSMLKIAQISANNSLGHPCVFFRVYPVGLDTFVIKTFSNLSKDKLYNVYIKYGDSSTYQSFSLIDENVSGSSFGNIFYRILGNSWKSKIRTAFNVRTSSRLTKRQFSFFICDTETGICTQFTNDITLENKKRGTRLFAHFTQ